MRLIDAERIPNDEFFKGLTDIEKAKVLQWFVSAPTVDAVEVVRCKDCKYFRRWNDGSTTCLFWTEQWDMVTEPNGFCSYAERTEDNE
jgi:hypothetical protein